MLLAVFFRESLPEVSEQRATNPPTDCQLPTEFVDNRVPWEKNP